MVRSRCFAAREHGASMIEVLIALTLVAFTMLGLLGLQLRSVGIQKDSLDRRNAAQIVSGFAERITGNFSGFVANEYTGRALAIAGSAPTALTACGTPCTPNQIAARDWEALQMEVRRKLPGGVVYLNSADSPRRVEIIVGWVDPQRQQEELAKPVGDRAVDPICARAPASITDLGYRCYIAAIHP
jgi:type IV pilus modification protein PilV